MRDSIAFVRDLPGDALIGQGAAVIWRPDATKAAQSVAHSAGTQMELSATF